MSIGCEWISGIYGMKTSIVDQVHVHGIDHFIGFFIEPSSCVLSICKVGRVEQVINECI